MRALVAGLLIALTCACTNEPDSGPQIFQLNRTEASAGDVLDLAGHGFCGDTGVNPGGVCAIEPAAAVRIGAEALVVRAEAERWLDERVTVQLPVDLALGATVVTVTVEGVVSNAVELEVVP